MSTGQCWGKRHDTSMSLKPLLSTKKTALDVTDSGTTGSSTGDRANVKHGYTPNPWGGVGREREREEGDSRRNGGAEAEEKVDVCSTFQSTSSRTPSLTISP